MTPWWAWVLLGLALLFLCFLVVMLAWNAWDVGRRSERRRS